MINNKRLLWGISAALVLVNAIAAFVIMRRRQAARKRTPLQEAMDTAATNAQLAAQSIEAHAEEAARATRRGFSKLRHAVGK